jgi:hypothetical protein
MSQCSTHSALSETSQFGRDQDAHRIFFVRYPNPLKGMGLWPDSTALQATGSLLSVIFFLGLVQLAGGVSRLSGVLTLLGSAVLLGVVLIEGAFTIDLAQAAVDGHPAASVTSFDVMTVFTHIYPIVPAPLIFLSLGTILIGSSVLPRIFGILALVLGCLYAIAGLVGLFTSPVITPVPLGLQSLWILAAAIALVSRSGNTGQATSTGYQDMVTASR